MKKTLDILMKVFFVLIFIGAWAVMAVFIDWGAGIEHKINLLRALLIASTALVGFGAIFLARIIRDYENLVRNIGMSEGRMKACRLFLSWSIIAGCLAILAAMFYFVSYEVPLMVAAWVLFILQLELFILPLIFARIVIFR